MKFFTATSFIAAFVAAAFAAPNPAGAPMPTAVSISYDQAYDNSAASLDTVACSNGQYGLESKGPSSRATSSTRY